MAEGRNQENQGGRGFAGMDDQRQREIAAEGGRASHEQGTGHEFTSEEAREAGRKGGQASHGGGQSGNQGGQGGNRGGQGGNQGGQGGQRGQQ